ncbi:MAG TPA: phosphoglycolate phosphatase [Amaricoccus sp.]|nr:phosphoglycolate phosphatase [Amaricoccus sp.]
MARIIFDLDGTLVESAPSLTAAANALLAELGREPLSEGTTRTFVGHGVKVLVERVLTHTGGIPGGDSAPHLERFRAIYNADPVTGTEPIAGVPVALAALAAAGHGLGVCTQKPNLPAVAILKALGLMPPVTALTDGDSLAVMKPDPRMLDHAAAQLPEGPVLFVGDSEVDAATAEAARVPFLLYTEGYRGQPVEALRHAAAFSDFAALPGLVETLLAHACGEVSI